MINGQSLVDEAVASAVKQFAPVALRAEELAVTFVDLGKKAGSPMANHRGEVPIYPASVIKLFYLVAVHRQLEEGELEDTPELRRALYEMIHHSGNDSTNYLVDLLTGTTSGPELTPQELAVWLEKRELINRYFHATGYPEINASRKTWHEGAFGRDLQAVTPPAGRRNFLTTNATARLLAEIAALRCVSADRSAQMLEVLKRDLTDPARSDHQTFAYTGLALPPGAKLWSKAGYMSQAKHDAALVELADGTKFVLVIFTTRPADGDIIPAIARQIVAGLYR